MLSRPVRSAWREVGLAVLAFFAIQGLMYYVSEPMPLPSLLVVMGTFCVARFIIVVQRMKRSEPDSEH